MSTSNPSVSLDVSQIDVAQVTPTVDMVAALERTRTVDANGTDEGTFTALTSPTATEVQALIAQALTIIVTQLPQRVPVNLYSAVKQAVAVQAAILVETSYYREQGVQSAVQVYEQMLGNTMTMVKDLADTRQTGRRVDSVLARGTMTDYDPFLLPVPPQIVQSPPAPIEVGLTGQ